MEKITTIIQHVKHFMSTAGPAWDIFVILFLAMAIAVWADVMIGNKIRIRATGLVGIWIETALNWYILKKNIAKARSFHIATRKQYWVIPLGGRYHVINKYQRQRINNLLRKYHATININDVLKIAVFHTK